MADDRAKPPAPLADLTTKLRRHKDIANCNGCMICTAADELERLRGELAEDGALLDRMTKILIATANALHGGPLANGFHSWHDLSERAERMRAAGDALAQTVKAVHREGCRCNTCVMARAWEEVRNV